MSRRAFAAGALSLATAPLAARAQQQGRMPRIAILATVPQTSITITEIVEGLRDYGYVHGRNVIIEHFNAPSIAELEPFGVRVVASNPDLIITSVTPASLLMKRLTQTIPIVFSNVGAPVEVGLVASLARPGGNLTGTSNINNQLAGKRLQLLSEIVPRLSRIAVFMQPEDPNSVVNVAEVAEAARTLTIDVDVIQAPAGKDFAPLFEQAVRNGVQAVYLTGTVYFTESASRLSELALRHRLPATFGNRAGPDAGALMSYGADVAATRRRVAYFVDRILKGAKPSDLPVEQPMTFELVINKRSADAVGLTIPERLLVFATEVIE